MKHLLIVEDDKNLNHGIKIALRRDYLCTQAFSVEEAGRMWEKEQFDLILLDVTLPDGNGIDFMLTIRKTSRVPIILLTANKMEMDIVSGLELGANDYITKPFSLMVLRARVGVWLREERESESIFHSGDYYFNFDTMEFRDGGRRLEFSKTEQKLLRCLLENKGKSVSRGRLIDRVWEGETEFVDEHALTVVVNRIRGKLRDHPDRLECIKTVYGIGYMWVDIKCN